MDFVDLDKVLDQFEEEEKAAGQLVAGQEVKPSGYGDYLASHQDRPWEALSSHPPPHLIKQQMGLHPHSVAYDDPYDKLKDSSSALRQVNLYHSVNGTGSTETASLQEELSQAKLKEQTIEAYLPALRLSNGHEQSMNGCGEGGRKEEEEERRGLIASQPASIQTDTLSPTSEQQLRSFPLPQSDILVERHPDGDLTDTASHGNLQNGAHPVHAAHDAERNACDVILYQADSRHESSADVNFDQNQSNTEQSRPLESSLALNEGTRSEEQVLSNNLSGLTDIPSDAKEGTLMKEPVGFETEECEMDTEELDAYLQELVASAEEDEDRPGETCGSQLDTQKDEDSVGQQSEPDSGHGQEESAVSCRENAGQHSEADAGALAAGDHTEVNPRLGGALPSVEGKQGDDGNVSLSNTNNCSVLDIKQPDVVADISPRPPDSSCGMQEADIAVTKPFTHNNLAERVVASPALSKKVLNVNSNVRMVEGSLDFPVTDATSELSSAVKGKLEIEGLLDEILAARLAQKPTQPVNLDQPPVTPPSPAVEQLMPSDPASSHQTRTHRSRSSPQRGRERESGSESPETRTPAASPSPTLGIGARPKDPSQMKRSRPTSLLGLSKISLTSPFSPPQHGGEPAVGVVRPQSASEDCVEGQNGVVNDWRSPADQGVELRGGEEGVEASSGTQRPQSWSPATVSSPPSQRSKRPTSLNLPVRQQRLGSTSPEDSPPPTHTGYPQEAAPAYQTGPAEEGRCGEGGTDSYGLDDSGSVEPETLEGAASAAELPPDQGPPSILQLNLGKIAPTWLPDADAPQCMQCSARFTFTKRRHHCRACGKIFCSTCCGQKSRLTYLENKEGRVCLSCHLVLSSADCVSSAGVACRSPNPNNPIEYCSTVPPSQQANARAPLPVVMVPSGVLKRQGSNRKSEPKQVMFSDGIRPGGDLTELDGSDQARVPPRRTARAQKKVEKQQGGDHTSPKTRRLRGSDGTRNPCLIPEEGLPPVVLHTDEKGEVSLSETLDPAALMAQIRDTEASPVIFAINLDLFVHVKIINLDCCVKRVVWCFMTRGMVTAGQEELVMVLEALPDEESPPRDIFCHFSTVYSEAGKGNTVSNLGHSIFSQPFLGSGGHGGMLYLRPSFQCTSKLLLPPTPFLFALLLQKWETPWAKVFPIRLMLRLGAEFRYYPCPLVSIRNRKPVFYEIGHTIMNLLADFRNFQYMLQQIRGVTIHMQDKKTLISFPRNRYQEVMKVVSGSNEHVMALGGSFSTEADSHLVCIQSEEGNYQTQAINIENKPRQVTGASFVVFNGALKSSSGLRAKSSIVEDGLMVQITPDTMAALKVSLKDMTDFTISCGSVSAPHPDEVVTLRWVPDDKNVNIGVKSCVDGLPLEGVESVHVHNATDYVGERYAIRWTEVFFLQAESGDSRWEPVDLSRVAETLASATCIALTPHLHTLRQAGLAKIALRVTLQPDSVGYEVGANGERLPDLYMNDLDNALIPVIHGAISHNQDSPIVLELVLHIIH